MAIALSSEIGHKKCALPAEDAYPRQKEKRLVLFFYVTWFPRPLTGALTIEFETRGLLQQIAVL